MKIGILREGKTPPDKRVALTPDQCVQLQQAFPEVDLVVQNSPIRCFTDQQYADLGIVLAKDVSDSEVLIRGEGST